MATVLVIVKITVARTARVTVSRKLRLQRHIPAGLAIIAGPRAVNECHARSRSGKVARRCRACAAATSDVDLDHVVVGSVVVTPDVVEQVLPGNGLLRVAPIR